MSSMMPEQIIEEWEKGCTIAGPASADPRSRPEDCPECTRGMVDALKKSLAERRKEREKVLRDFRMLVFVGCALGLLVIGLVVEMMALHG